MRILAFWWSDLCVVSSLLTKPCKDIPTNASRSCLLLSVPTMPRFHADADQGVRAVAFGRPQLRGGVRQFGPLGRVVQYLLQHDAVARGAVRRRPVRTAHQTLRCTRYCRVLKGARWSVWCECVATYSRRPAVARLFIRQRQCSAAHGIYLGYLVPLPWCT